MALELTESFGGGDMERILGGDNNSVHGDLINHEKSKYAYSQAMRPCINATNMSNKIPHIED